MHDQPSAPGQPSLTNQQAARLDFATRDYEYARSEDLAQLEADGLILLIERLRRRLGDMLDLVGEISKP